MLYDFIWFMAVHDMNIHSFFCTNVFIIFALAKITIFPNMAEWTGTHCGVIFFKVILTIYLRNSVVEYAPSKTLIIKSVT